MFSHHEFFLNYKSHKFRQAKTIEGLAGTFPRVEGGSLPAWQHSGCEVREWQHHAGCFTAGWTTDTHRQISTRSTMLWHFEAGPSRNHVTADCIQDLSFCFTSSMLRRENNSWCLDSKMNVSPSGGAVKSLNRDKNTKRDKLLCNLKA